MQASRGSASRQFKRPYSAQRKAGKTSSNKLVMKVFIVLGVLLVGAILVILYHAGSALSRNK